MKEIHHQTVPSTHKWAIDNVNELKGEPIFFITADHQTESVGRRPNTNWESAPGENLLATFFIRGPLSFPIHNIAQVLAVSLMKQLIPENLNLTFKWPNDLHLSGKKFAGVMGDIKDENVIVSIGANINMGQEDLDKIDVPANSLAVETGRKWDLEAFKAKYRDQVEKDIATFKEKGFAPFLHLVREKLSYRGQKVRVGEATGIVVDVDQDGCLVIDTDNGKKTLSAGHLELID